MGSGTKINGLPINMTKNTKLTSAATTITESGIIVEKPSIIIDENTFLVERKKQEEKVRAERDKVTTYNNRLLETKDPVVESMVILGPKVLLRLFKLQKYTEAGAYCGGRTLTVMSKSEMNKEIVEAPDDVQFQERGVVVAISDDCSANFKAKVKVGDIVDIDPSTNIQKQQRILHKETIIAPFDNYFLVSEFAIENVVKSN